MRLLRRSEHLTLPITQLLGTYCPRFRRVWKARLTGYIMPILILRNFVTYLLRMLLC